MPTWRVQIETLEAQLFALSKTTCLFPNPPKTRTCLNTSFIIALHSYACLSMAKLVMCGHILWLHVQTHSKVACPNKLTNLPLFSTYLNKVSQCFEYESLQDLFKIPHLSIKHHVDDCKH